jgi:hypothetical protein
LYGEGYGPGINKGGVYGAEQKFVLFDVLINSWWLRRDDVNGVASAFGLESVPVILTASVFDAIGLVENGLKSYWNSDHVAEGLVGRVPSGFLFRTGAPILMKIKSKDFPQQILNKGY